MDTVINPYSKSLEDLINFSSSYKKVLETEAFLTYFPVYRNLLNYYYIQEMFKAKWDIDYYRLKCSMRNRRLGINSHIHISRGINTTIVSTNYENLDIPNINNFLDCLSSILLDEITLINVNPTGYIDVSTKDAEYRIHLCHPVRSSMSKHGRVRSIPTKILEAFYEEFFQFYIPLLKLLTLSLNNNQYLNTQLNQ